MNLSSLLTIVIALGLIVVLLSLVRSYRQLRPVAPQPGGEEGVNLPQMAGDFGPRPVTAVPMLVYPSPCSF